MIVRVRHSINRSYIIEALTYWIIQKGSRKIELLNRKMAVEIVRRRVFFSGQSNWVGDGGQVHEMLGDATENYNAIQAIVTEWVDKNKLK